MYHPSSGIKLLILFDLFTDILFINQAQCCAHVHNNSRRAPTDPTIRGPEI